MSCFHTNNNYLFITTCRFTIFRVKTEKMIHQAFFTQQLRFSSWDEFVPSLIKRQNCPLSSNAAIAIALIHVFWKTHSLIMIYKNQHPCILNSNLQDFILKKCTSQTKPPPPPQDMVVLRKPTEQKECAIGWVFDILKPPPGYPGGIVRLLTQPGYSHGLKLQEGLRRFRVTLFLMLLRVSKNNRESKS